MTPGGFPEPVLDAAAVTAIIHSALASDGFSVLSVTPGEVVIELTDTPWMRRPGGSLSGPALFTAADAAMYALVLATAGPERMALTADLAIRFLGRARPGPIRATARGLKWGRRLVSMEVSITTAGRPETVAHATGSYVRPDDVVHAEL